ncbi:MAG: glycosyltransferase [Syntrophobacterales bacterium]|nr:glycosyltransferase [Syntrophobacterales bacterium]
MVWLTVALLLSLAPLTWLVLAGSRRLARRGVPEVPPPTAPWPRVSLIVPVTGRPEGLAEELTSLLTQDYPDCEILVITASPDEPAVPVIRELLGRFPQMRHGVSGLARGCGQKNHNLLAGLRLADPSSPVIAFCDRGRLAPPDFLRHLVAPLLGKAGVASGYHVLCPMEPCLALWARAAVVLVLRLTREFPALMQPWGGATAIRRELLLRLDLPALWARTVVDDVSLAARLKAHRLPVAPAPGALLLTPAAAETWGQARAWLTRQWLYLKYYLPGTWLAAGLLVHLTLALAAAALLLLLFTPFRGLGPLTGAAAGYLAALGLLVARLHGLLKHPDRGGLAWLTWPAALALASVAHLASALRHSLVWHGWVYRLGCGGEVRRIWRAES